MKLDDIQLQTRQTQATAVARATLTAAEVGPWLRGAYAAVAGRPADTPGLAGPAFAGYHEFGEGRLEEAGFPASGPVEHGGELAGDAWVVYLSDPPAQPDPVKLSGTRRTGQSPCGPAFRQHTRTPSPNRQSAHALGRYQPGPAFSATALARITDRGKGSVGWF